jgi:hypothetical protein
VWLTEYRYLWWWLPRYNYTLNHRLISRTVEPVKDTVFMRSLNSLEKWSYAVGSMPFAVKDAAFVNFVVFYYTQVQGLSGTLTGLAMFLAVGAGVILCWWSGVFPLPFYFFYCLIRRPTWGR